MPQPPAFNAVGGQASSGSLHPAHARHVAASDLPWQRAGLRAFLGPDGHVEVPDPPAGSGPPAASAQRSTQGHAATPDPSPSGERVRGRCPAGWTGPLGPSAQLFKT